MSIFDDFFSDPTTLAKGTFLGGGIAGTALGGAANVKNSADNRAVSSADQARDIYNNSLMSNAASTAADKKNQYYGTSLNNLGGETQSYVDSLKGNLDKNVAKADIYNQQQAQSRGLSNARAGLSGVDTSAMNEQSRRNASFGASTINEDAKRNALDMYGQSISNRIEGANKIDNNQAALAIAQMKQPETNYKPGLLGSLFSGFL